MKSGIFSLVLFCFFAVRGYAQTLSKPVVGVAKFSSEVESPFVTSVAEKVVNVITQTKRFIVVDRTSYDKIQEELEFQKTEAFLDSKNTVKQGEALAAQYMILGHLIKMNIYVMKNDGVPYGYKASASFTLKMNNVETGETTEATSFQTSVSPLAASKEQAVNQALQSVEIDLLKYFTRTFPVKVGIVKLLKVSGKNAQRILVNGGKDSGLYEGADLIVEQMELLEGKLYPTEIGKLRVDKLVGEDFSECKVITGGVSILSHFNAGSNIICKLLVK